MLRLNLSKEEKKELSLYLKDEIGTAISDRVDLETKWAKWERQYEGRPEEGKKTFPWDNACNVVVPVTGSIIDALLARVMDMWKVEPFFTVRSLNPQIDAVTQQLGQLLEWANKHELKLFNAMIPTILSTLKFGNGFCKLTWTSFNTNTASEGGFYRHVPVQDMLFPAGCLDIHTARWVGDRAKYTFSDLKRMEADGLLQDVNALRDKEEQEPLGPLATEQEDLGGIPNGGELHTLYDVWMGWDINGDDIDEEIHIAVSYPSFKIHGIWINEYGHRPYRHFKMFPRENHIYAMGLCEYLSDLQEEITTIHRQRTDNATLANTRFFKGRAGATGIKPGMKIWPGRVLMMDDPVGDLVTEQLGEVYQSSAQNEIMLMSMIEKRAGLSDVAMGKAPRRETATTTLALIQEGNRRLEFLITYIKAELAEMAMDYLELYRQFAPKDRAIRILGPEGAMVSVILDMPESSLRGRVSLEVTAGAEMSSKEMERQQLIQLFGLFKEFYMQMFQLAMMIANPQVPPEVRQFALQVAGGATKFMEQIGDNFNLRDAKDMIPNLMAVFGGGANGGGMEGVGGQPGMEAMQGGMEGPTGGNRGPNMESDQMGGFFGA